MVDAVVSLVVQRIGDYLIREAIFLGEVRNEVVSLKNELEWMQYFIKDAAEKQNENPMIRKWVSDIRDIAYDTEDVLDKFLIQVENGRSSNGIEIDEGSTSKKRSRLFASIKKHTCSCILHKGKDKMKLYSIGKEIEALKKRISDLSLKRERYGLQDINNKREAESKALEKLKQLRRSTSFGVEQNVVGFEDDAEKLLAQLLNNDPQRIVISIFGMGGLGKTTLAGKLYRNKDVKNKFPCSAWVSVSQDYKIADLLRRIIKSFKIEISNSELEEMNEEDMERLLHNILQERSYLVTVDDVWQKEAWESLKRAFPDNNKGSRVIITTRVKDVAERSDERSHVHKLRFLRTDESWQLFREKAFRNIKADHGLEKLGREMLEKCRGLPLAIVVLGGLLSTKKPQEWRVVRDHIWRHLRNDSIHISSLLALSFNDLPYQLKLCFLYLGLFPEDFEIEMEKIILLLVAEGFISPPPDEDQTTEDAAHDHLVQLIDRSLIQVAQTWWGKIATLRVHDLLRDLAIEKSKELNFIHIHDQTKNSSSSASMSTCRRQAVYSMMEDFSIQQLCPLSRSLLLFNQSFHVQLDLFVSLQLLRVLDINFAGQGYERTIPEAIGTMIHLKYLGFRNGYTSHVSPSVLINLQRLQTLNLLSDRANIRLPDEICKLKELRHLIGRFEGHLQIDNLTQLQTLKYLSHDTWSKIDTDKLVNLRKLHIGCKVGNGATETFTFNSISKMRNLQLLSVELADNTSSFATLQPLSNCPCLIDLRLLGKISELPEELHEVLPNLKCLWLEKSQFKDDPMPILEKLSNLVILKFWFSYKGRKLVCSNKGFPRLQILDIQLVMSAELQVEFGAMPMLTGLRTNAGTSVPYRLLSIPTPTHEELDFRYWSDR